MNPAQSVIDYHKMLDLEVEKKREIAKIKASGKTIWSYMHPAVEQLIRDEIAKFPTYRFKEEFWIMKWEDDIRLDVRVQVHKL